MPSRREGKITRVLPGHVEVDLGDEMISAFLRGQLKSGPRDRRHVVAVGDDVLLRFDPRGSVVEEVLPRRNRISRVAPGNSRTPIEHVIAANLDWMIVVVSLDRPRFNPRGTDRLLVLGELSGVQPMLVFNKSDLESPTRAGNRPGHPDLADPSPAEDGSNEGDPMTLYSAIGYPVLRTSALTGEGIDALASQLRGRVSLLAGASGVGKSSLLNSLVPGAEGRVGEVSEATGKGIHTTTSVHWFSLAGGGALVDSPGLRSIQPWGLDAVSLPRCFPEFREVGECQFRDCGHVEEPSCAVRRAVAEGAVHPSRYESYLRLRDGGFDF